MKMGDILSYRQTGESFASGAVSDISGDHANELSSINISRKNNRATTDAIDCHTVDKVSMAGLSPRADNSREKTHRVTRDGGKSEPSDLRPDIEPGATWKQWYDRLWEFKFAKRDEDDG